METTRPLMYLGISDLEDIFEKQEKNFATFARLKQELSHRQVPRAIALLERVQKAEAALKNMHTHQLDVPTRRTAVKRTPRTPEVAPAPAPEQGTLGQPVSEPVLRNAPLQQDLLTGFGQSSSGAGPLAPSGGVFPERNAPQKPPAAGPEAIPQLALEDACRILKVTTGDVWEKVEASRRKIVLKSSPLMVRSMTFDQTQKLLADARLANDAACVIAARRSGRL